MKVTVTAGDNDYDINILKLLYQDSTMILSHRRYDLLIDEFREKDHQNYLRDNQQQ